MHALAMTRSLFGIVLDVVSVACTAEQAAAIEPWTNQKGTP
jgi:hypothetical protein